MKSMRVERKKRDVFARYSESQNIGPCGTKANDLDVRPDSFNGRWQIH